ncbi:type IV secretion system DNA-binding domain-containing protein, partial [Candidatus Parcubacteria bacterium]|nr:type IV secretion system DNA-binding domain-containing protein [Candidatus Parcubacteria bacterium]
MKTDITYFAKTNFREKEHVFGIKRDDRGRHTYVIGKTGMGKTNLLETMIISDIRAGNGVAVVDPHGDLAEKILNFIPASRINDVVYFNPADADYPIAFNVMEHVDSKYRHLVASGLIGVFKKIWADSWGPRLEYLLRNVILALLEYPGSTLLGVPRMFIDKDYRKKVVNKVSDPVVKAFWLNEFTKYSSQFTVDAISPIQNKVGQFLSSSLVRNIIAQTHSTIDMREIMDNKKIFIINLAKGKIGEDYSALLGAMLITKIQLAAMGRSDIPEEERKNFYLYVDEFQNFATESFAGILSEARKYRLNLIVAHQYIGQLEEEVRDAIFGNVGTIITFRVGAADAEFLEKEFEPVFMMNDLVNLAKYDIYLKLMIDGVTGDAFSATTLPPSKVTEQ